MHQKSIYFVWQAYQRRAESMQAEFGYDLYYIPPSRSGIIRKLFGYVRQSISTFNIIREVKPSAVIYQSPPTFVGHVIWFSILLLRQHCSLIADCHNAATRSPWSLVPFNASILRRCKYVIVHNEESAVIVDRKLGTLHNLIVLEDPPADIQVERRDETVGDPYVLVPCSFNADEPIQAVLDCATELSDLRFKITGRLEKARRQGYLNNVPPNVEFLGFVPIGEFDRLLVNASVVLGLTKFEGIQLSVASEAIGAGKGVILSNTRILKKLFGDAAVLTTNQPDDLREKIRVVMSNVTLYEQRSLVLARKRWSDWKKKAAELGLA